MMERPAIPRLCWALAVFVSCSAPEQKPTPATSSIGDAAPFVAGVRGMAPRALGGFPSVVLLVPENAPDLPIPEEPALMDQYGNAFHPRVLVVRHGQPVEFRNSEDVLHNVHVFDTETRETVFNVGTPVVGSYRYTFAEPGAYDVSCDIHPAMAAFVIVAPTPYAAIADREGNFELPDVPPGFYELSVWNLDPARRIRREVAIGPGRTELDLVRD